MATNITLPDPQTRVISGIQAYAIPLPITKPLPIRLYVYGASDGGGSTSGMKSYIFTMRKSKFTDSTVDPLEPSGIVALSVDSDEYKLFTSGYNTKVWAEIDTETAGYFPSTGICAFYSGTVNPSSGLIFPVTGFTYSGQYTYMLEWYDWDENYYYWFYIGAKDKAGNATLFKDMKKHPGNPWKGNVPSYIDIQIPVEDNTPPSGMSFFIS